VIVIIITLEKTKINLPALQFKDYKVKYNKNYYVHEIESRVANKFIKEYHYSKKVVPNSKLHLGVFNIYTNELEGVLSFGYPMNPKSTPQKIVLDSNYKEMYELNRMAMSDEAPKLSESQALGLCIRWLKEYQKHIKWILSFSDGKEGNVGIIYQATNWDYLGYRVSDSFYDLDGQIMHSVQIWHKFKEGKPDVNTMEEVCKRYNNVKKIKSKQYIYVCNLTKGKLNYFTEVKPYPKKESEPRILEEIIYKEDGVLLSKKKIIKHV